MGGAEEAVAVLTLLWHGRLARGRMSVDTDAVFGVENQVS